MSKIKSLVLSHDDGTIAMDKMEERNSLCLGLYTWRQIGIYIYDNQAKRKIETYLQNSALDTVSSISIGITLCSEVSTET